jgi:hypothetical protein
MEIVRITYLIERNQPESDWKRQSDVKDNTSFFLLSSKFQKVLETTDFSFYKI